jgi:hypothetical protein
LKRASCAAFLITLLTGAVFASPAGKDYAKGPLWGASMYIPYLIHYTFPTIGARADKAGSMQISSQLYYINDVEYEENQPFDKTHRTYNKANISRDYESCVAELGFRYTFPALLTLGIDTRLVSYYGGFLDPVVEAVHSIGFPGGGREYFKQDRLYINIPNDRGSSLFLDKPAVSLGDTALSLKWPFYQSDRIALALIGAFKLPTGQFAKLSGSGSPDAGASVSADFNLSRLFSLYTQAGLVLPFDLASYYPMFNGAVSLEFKAWKTTSLVLQMNIKTSSIKNNILWSWSTEANPVYAYSLPQMDILFGAVFVKGGSRWQLNFEEDAITNQGPDITIGLRYSYTFHDD